MHARCPTLRAIKSFGLRFSAPVYPGETIRTQMWRDPGPDANADTISFRATIGDRVVLNNGYATVTP